MKSDSIFERFTDRAQRVMKLANEEATRLNHVYLGSGHILLGLVKEGGGISHTVLKGLGVDLKRVRYELEKIEPRGVETVGAGKLPLTPRAMTIIENARKEAHQLKHNYLGTEHLLLALTRDQDGPQAVVLSALGVRFDDVWRKVLDILEISEDEIGSDAHDAMDANAANERIGLKPLTLLLDPGDATPEDIAELFLELSTLYRMIGGSGINFKYVDAREPVVA